VYLNRILKVNQKHGQFLVSLIKDPATSKGDEFGLSVTLPKKLNVSFDRSTYASCTEIMSVDVMVCPVHTSGSATKGINFFIQNINQIDAFLSGRL
jgi:hypothetical protein